jgi:hypothetical protein
MGVLYRNPRDLMGRLEMDQGMDQGKGTDVEVPSQGEVSQELMVMI